MRTSSTTVAAVALAAAAFALPALAAPPSQGDASPPNAAAMPSNPAPAPRTQMNNAASPSAQSDMNKNTGARADMHNDTAAHNDTAVAAAPDAMAGSVAGHRASQIIGTAVVNDKDESIGKVDDILIGPQDKATMAVISVGGFLGIGAKLVAVPFDQLQPAPNDKKSLTLPNASKTQLKSMPAFKYGHGA